MSDRLRILALDCSTVTGWAASDEHGHVESGRQEFPLRRGSSPGFRFLEFRIWLESLIKATRPEVIVYEQAHHRGGAAAELCVGFTTRVMEAAAAAGVEYRAVHSQTLKAWGAGSGNADKAAMQKAAAARFTWYVPARDPGCDEGDALLLLAYAQAGFPERERKKKKRAATKRKTGPQPALGIGG